MKKKTILKIKSVKPNVLVKTSFNCPIELRNRLEQLINEYSEKYTPEEIIYSLLDDALKKYGF